MKIFQFITFCLKCPKLLCIRFEKIDGFIYFLFLQYNLKHLILFDYRLFNKLCDKIKYPISTKTGITNSNNDNFGRIIIDSYNSLLTKNILTFRNVIVLIK